MIQIKHDTVMCIDPGVYRLNGVLEIFMSVCSNCNCSTMIDCKAHKSHMEWKTERPKHE